MGKLLETSRSNASNFAPVVYLQRGRGFSLPADSTQGKKGADAGDWDVWVSGMAPAPGSGENPLPSVPPLPPRTLEHIACGELKNVRSS